MRLVNIFLASICTISLVVFADVKKTPPNPSPGIEPEPQPEQKLQASLLNACFNGECSDYIQISGAKDKLTNGGMAVKSLRTIYFNRYDVGEHPVYEGEEWPYVISSIDINDIVVQGNIKRYFSLNSDGHVLINGKNYQYSGDSLRQILMAQNQVMIGTQLLILLLWRKYMLEERWTRM